MYANRCQIVLGSKGLEITRELVAGNATELLLWSQIAYVQPLKFEQKGVGDQIWIYRFNTRTCIRIVNVNGLYIDVELQEVTNQGTWSDGTIDGINQAITDISPMLRGGVPVDPLAKLFIETVGITDTSQRTAINYLATQLRLSGLLPKCKVLYPYCGTTATQHSYNLLDTSQFQITWMGSPSHSIEGVFFNGTTQYGKTGFIASSNLTIDNISTHHYSRRTQSGVSGHAWGALSTANNLIRLIPFYNGVGPVSSQYDTVDGELSGTINFVSGLISGVKTAQNVHKIYRNGVLINTKALFAGGLPTVEFYIGALNNNDVSPLFFLDNEIQTSLITEGLIASEIVTLNAILSNYLNILVSGSKNTTTTVLYEGNSFMASYNLATSISTYLTNNGYTVSDYNGSVGASSISSIVGSSNYMGYKTREINIQNSYGALSNKNIMPIFELINELYYQYSIGGASLADGATNSYTSLVNYITETRTGNKIDGFVINTLTPRNNIGTPADYEAGRQLLNTALRSDFNVPTAYARVFTSNLSKWSDCVLVDVGNDPNFGQPGDENDPVYYQADLVHPTALMVSEMTSNYYGPAITLL